MVPDAPPTEDEGDPTALVADLADDAHPADPAKPAPPEPPADPAPTRDAVEPVEGAPQPTPERGAEPLPVAAAIERATRRSRFLRPLRYLVAAVLGVALTVAVLAGTGSLGAASAVVTPSPSTTPTALPTPAPTFGFDGYTMGVASAPVTIEIWADFQCPYCGLLAHGIEPALVREIAVAGKARIRYRDFAFLGQESTDAAVAASCADRQGMFWRYHDLLFASQSGENQGAFARDRLLGLAKFAGIADTSAFTACLGDPAVAQRVAAETQEGRAYGITSTPTIRVVGPGPTQLLEGVTDPAKILAALDRASTPAPSSSLGPVSSPSVGANPAPSASPR